MTPEETRNFYNQIINIKSRLSVDDDADDVVYKEFMEVQDLLTDACGILKRWF